MPSRLPGYEPGEEDEPRKGPKKGSKMLLREFECPTCSANNPYDDGFGDGDEVLCNYCGLQFVAKVDDEGKLKLRET